MYQAIPPGIKIYLNSKIVFCLEKQYGPLFSFVSRLRSIRKTIWRLIKWSSNIFASIYGFVFTILSVRELFWVYVFDSYIDQMIYVSVCVYIVIFAFLLHDLHLLNVPVTCLIVCWVVPLYLVFKLFVLKHTSLPMLTEIHLFSWSRSKFSEKLISPFDSWTEACSYINIQKNFIYPRIL